MKRFIGAHMSIAGGYYKAVEAAAQCDMNCVQLFTKNNNQWRAKPLSDDDVSRFQEKLAELGVSHPISHDSYLINMASPDKALWQKSVDAFVEELERAHRLGIPYVVAHPGSHTTASEEEGLERIVRALNEVHARTAEVSSQCLLENTAGQGSNLGWKFEHLAAIRAGIRQPKKVGVCIDTCHLFAAGYPVATPLDYKTTMKTLDDIVGLEHVKAFHLNDSKKPLGSRVDRHEHIGEGCLGLEPFRNLLNDRRFKKIPMYLETPKGLREGTDLDSINLATLRALLKS